MKKGIIIGSVFMSAFVAQPSTAAPSCGCTYPLDATAAQYSAFGATPFPTISGQTTMHHVIDTAGGPLTQYHAFSSSAATAVSGGQQGDITLPSSGIIAFEIEISDYLSTNPSDSYDEGITLQIRTGIDVLAAVGHQAVHPPYYAGPRTIAVLLNGATAVGSEETGTALPLSDSFRYGIYFNMDTLKMGYTINGVDKGYLAGNIPSGISKVAIAVVGTTYAPSTEVLLGELVRTSLVTDASVMNQPYPSGAMDICGNSI